MDKLRQKIQQALATVPNFRDLKEHIEIIRNLDPKPGSRHNPSQSQYVIPDVYVLKVEDPGHS